MRLSIVPGLAYTERGEIQVNYGHVHVLQRGSGGTVYVHRYLGFPRLGRRGGGGNPTLYYKERQEGKGERCEYYAETGREHEVLPER